MSGRSQFSTPNGRRASVHSLYGRDADAPGNYVVSPTGEAPRTPNGPTVPGEVRRALPPAVADVLDRLASRAASPASAGVERVADEDILDLLDPIAALGTRPRIERKEERRPSNWIAIAYLPDGTEVPCGVKDVSKSGARIGVPDKIRLSPRFALRVMGIEVVLQVRVAWRRDNHVGLAIEQMLRSKAAPATH